ncbi:putative acyltransfersase [Powellomyces hirtus]|nr:putative acyltransfersase [Powellomyces hirtus]
MDYIPYVSELQLPAITALIENDLSEPYSIYTYRYFLHNWPQLCFLATPTTPTPAAIVPPSPPTIGVIICKLDTHKEVLRGYIGMLAVAKRYRHQRVASTLVKMAVCKMKEEGAHEVVLETEETNTAALKLYERLGFVRDKRLERYYLNGVDAFRLKLRLRD